MSSPCSWAKSIWEVMFPRCTASKVFSGGLISVVRWHIIYFHSKWGSVQFCITPLNLHLDGFLMAAHWDHFLYGPARDILEKVYPWPFNAIWWSGAGVSNPASERPPSCRNYFQHTCLEVCSDSESLGPYCPTHESCVECVSHWERDVGKHRHGCTLLLSGECWDNNVIKMFILETVCHFVRIFYSICYFVKLVFFL